MNKPRWRLLIFHSESRFLPHHSKVKARLNLTLHSSGTLQEQISLKKFTVEELLCTKTDQSDKLKKSRYNFKPRRLVNFSFFYISLGLGLDQLLVVPGWVLSDTERMARLEKRKSKLVNKKRAKIPKLEPGSTEPPIEEISESSGSSSKSDVSLFSSSNPLHWGFSDQELQSIRGTIQSSYNKLVKNFCQFYANNSSLYSKLTRFELKLKLLPACGSD